MDDRLLADLRLTRARALYAAQDVKAAAVEFVALAAESAGWDDDPGSHAMIAAETAVLLAESGEFDQARKAVDRDRRPCPSAPLRAGHRLSAGGRPPAGQRPARDGFSGALALLADASRVTDEASAASFEAGGHSLETALAYEHGRIHAYAGAYENAPAAFERALGLLGEPAPRDGRAGEWAECVRLAGVVGQIARQRVRTAAALQHQVRAAARERPAEGVADTARRSGYQHPAAGETDGVVRSRSTSSARSASAPPPARLGRCRSPRAAPRDLPPHPRLPLLPRLLLDRRQHPVGVNRRKKGAANTLAALKSIRAARPDDAPICVILDNLFAHKGEQIRRCARKSRVELCFTPTYASWADPIEAHLGPLRQFTIANCHHRNHTVQTRAPHAYLRWRSTSTRHPDVLAAQRREHARIRSEKGIR